MAVENEEQATRLARAIVGDIMLYNQESLAQTTPEQRTKIAEAVAEGRGLFVTRAAAFAAIFDQEVRERLPGTNAPPPAPAIAPPPAAERFKWVDPPVNRAPAATQSSPVLVALVAALIAGTIVFLLMR